MAEQDSYRQAFKIVIEKGLFYVINNRFRYHEAFSTMNKAEEYINSIITKYKLENIDKLFRIMKREPDIRKRTRMWKKICKLKSQL